MTVQPVVNDLDPAVAKIAEGAFHLDQLERVIEDYDSTEGDMLLLKYLGARFSTTISRLLEA